VDLNALPPVEITAEFETWRKIRVRKRRRLVLHSLLSGRHRLGCAVEKEANCSSPPIIRRRGKLGGVIGNCAAATQMVPHRCRL
jgi:SH3-like domain-containing protein